MGRELWPPLYRLVGEVARDFDQKYVRHRPAALVAVSLWAAIHDRPVSWACDPAHWDTARTDRPDRLPPASTVSRRATRSPSGCSCGRSRPASAGPGAGPGGTSRTPSGTAGRPRRRGRHYQGPRRGRSRELLGTRFGKGLYRLRAGIERRFAHRTGFAGGLQPLPAWVRGPGRVRTWVWAKLLINGVRILRKQRRVAWDCNPLGARERG